MELQQKYDELDDIIDTLDRLIDRIEDRNYIEQLEETKYEAQEEFTDVAERLQEERDIEERQQEKEYWEEAI